jgi:mRNA-degrading endonuclease RelE of RelBE toxin-antitoxin system
MFKMVFSSGAKKEVEQLPEAVQARIKSTVRYAKIW